MIRYLSILALLLTSCPAPVSPSIESACAAACDTGRRLACEWAATTPRGTTCEQVCRSTEATGYSTMHPACVAAAQSCEDAERVSRDGC